MHITYEIKALTLSKMAELIDSAIPQEWTRMFPTDKKIYITFNIELPDEHRSIELIIDRVTAPNGGQVIFTLKAMNEHP